VLTTIEPLDDGRVLLTYDVALEREPHKRQLFGTTGTCGF
jgi:hypothetical protein